MNDKVWWYLARSSGMVAMVLLVLSVVWGVLLATRALKPHDRPAWLLDLHRTLGGMALVMTGLHLTGLVLDDWIHFGATDLLLPGASEFKPFAVALGIVSMYVMFAVQVSSYLRGRLSARVWRGIHVSSYGMVWAAAIHAGLAGTDTTNRIYQALAIVLTMLAVAATIVRIVSPGKRAPRDASRDASRDTPRDTSRESVTT
jgi:DMSO/TMAO reductase YedYZ heme-binding membrane subunit